MDTLALILALKALSGGSGSSAVIVHELPTTDIKDGQLYILDTDWSINIHDTEGWHKLGSEILVVDTLPTTDIKDGQLYILSTDWTIHIHDENGWHTVGGQEIDKYLWETELTNGEIIYESTIKED